MPDVNESTLYTHFSNVDVGTANGGGLLRVKGVVQGQGFAKTVAADTTLTSADSGKTIILDNATGEVITLPALADGLNFRFIVGAAFATDNWVIDSAEGDNINGVITVNNTTILAAGEDQVNFVASAENIGDYVDLIADSGNSQWLVIGVGHAAGSITVTDPS